MRRFTTTIRRSLTLGVVLALASGVQAGCKEKPPEPGDECKPKDMWCVDKHTELACQDGVFIAAPCKGPKGCREDKDTLRCDFSGNAIGDPCSTEDDGNAKCIGDAKKWVICRGGKYWVEHCRGGEGCHRAGTLRCDQSKAVEGDACATKSNACSVDGLKVLTCKDGRFVATASCKGEAGCAVVDRKIQCDLGKKDDEGK